MHDWKITPGSQNSSHTLFFPFENVSISLIRLGFADVEMLQHELKKMFVCFFIKKKVFDSECFVLTLTDDVQTRCRTHHGILTALS